MDNSWIDTYFTGPSQQVAASPQAQPQPQTAPDWMDNYFVGPSKEAAPVKQEKTGEELLPEWAQTIHKAIGPDWGTALTLGSFGVRAPTGGSMLKAAPSAAPSPALTDVLPTSEIKGLSQQMYKEAEDAGVKYTPSGYNRLAYGLRHLAETEGLDKNLHPQSYSAISRIYANRVVPPKVDPLAKSGFVGEKSNALPNKTFSLEDIDTARRWINAARKSPNEADRRIANIAADRIDEFLSNPVASDIAAGDAQAASKAITAARALWSRAKKAEILDAIQERALNRVGANYTNAGLQTALRQEFKAIANNPNRMRQFDSQEQAVIKRIVRGASVENMLRWAGKFSPTSPMQAVISMFVGAPGGPVGQAALMGGGYAAASRSAAMQARKIQELNALVRRGYGNDASFPGE